MSKTFNSLFAAGVLLLCGCCDESHRNVSISGSVSYPGFQSGKIMLTLAEETSTRCSSGQSPGVRVASATMLQPEPFALQGNVCWAGSPPTLDLIAMYFEEQTGKCTAQAWLHLEPEDATDVSVVLTERQCNGRK